MRYFFGDYTLDVERRELSHRGHAVPLRPKVLDMLVYLIRHRDHAVAKQTLLTHLWPHVHVSPATLSACIKLARQAVGDSGAAQQVIQTLHGRGYRFVAPVAEEAPPPPLAALQPEERPRAPGPRLAPTATCTEAGGLPAAPAGVGPTAEGEYKPVTVLCCGLAVSSPGAAPRDAEGVYRRMQTVCGLALEVLERYGGTLLYQTGAGFTAVFGAPVAQEDHARRAVRAALALYQRLHAAPGDPTPMPEESLVVRMGLHSGLGVVGALGHTPSRPPTVVGEPITLAACLQDRAAPGTMLLSAATHRLVSAEVQIEFGPPIECEGSHPPVQGYRLVGCRQRETGGAGERPRVWGPLVGRERELTLLHERLAAACAGQGQVVSLIGEAGMGKTRLLMEFCRRLQGSRVNAHVGQCLSYGGAAPYHPVRGLLRQAWGIAEGLDPAAHITAVRRRLRDVEVVAEADVALVLQVLDLPVVPEALAPLHPQARQARTFALLRHLIRHAAQPQPLVLAVENLQWGDALSEAWLASLVEQLAGATLLLLVTYRPGYQPPWGPHATATQVVLPPLGAHDSWAVVQSLPRATRPSQALLQEIVTRAAGNPFFLEELVRHAADVEGCTTRMAVPATVQGVLAARLDRLPREAKALAQTAAVLGTTIPVSLLRAIAEMPEDTLQRGLAQLQAQDFLCEARVVPESTYTFKHALTQEVAYGSLLQERRRALHARLVDVLEASDAEQPGAQVEQLALHAVRGECWDQALTYSWQAGTKAFAHAAHREAVAWFEQALKILAYLPEDHDRRAHAITLRLDLRHALVRLGDCAAHHRVLDVLYEAERLAEAAGAHDQLVQIAAYLAHHFQWSGHYDQALTVGQRARALAVALGDEPLQGLADAELGPIYFALGNYPRAQEVLGHSIMTLTDTHGAERLNHITLLSVHPHAWLLMCLAQVGAFVAGRPLATEAIRIAEAGHAPYSLAMAYQGAGVLFLRQGDFPQAIAVLERGLAVCQAQNIESWFSGLAAALGYAYALAGCLSKALPLLEQVVAQDEAMRGERPRSPWVLWQSETVLLTGRVEEAWGLALQALELTRACLERGNEAWALWLLGEIMMRRQPLDNAHAALYYSQALALANALGMRPLQAHCHRGLGTLYAATGQREQAHAALSTAMALYRAMEMTFWLPQTEATLAQGAGA